MRIVVAAVGSPGSSCRARTLARHLAGRDVANSELLAFTGAPVEPGTKMSITAFESTATGTNELDLARPFASPSSMTSNVFMKLHIEADGLSGDMEQTMTMEMTVAER